MTGTSAQQQARALGDPTRHRIYRHIVDAGQAVDIAEVTEAAGVTHHAVRQHLAKLREAGLVVEEVEARNQPGRPRLRYRPHPDLAAEEGARLAYQRLASLLAEGVRTGASAVEVGRSAGRRAASGVAADDFPAAVGAVEVEMARQGFQPVRRDLRSRAELVLQQCPFVAVASVDRATVCSLHLGLAEGMAQELGSVAVSGLDARDPRLAGCVLRLRPPEGDGGDSELRLVGRGGPGRRPGA